MRVRQASQRVTSSVVSVASLFLLSCLFHTAGSPCLLDKVEDAVRIYQVDCFGNHLAHNHDKLTNKGNFC